MECADYKLMVILEGSRVGIYSRVRDLRECVCGEDSSYVDKV